MWRMGSPKTRGLHRRCPVAKAGCLSETCYVKEIILQTFHPRTRSAKHETNRNEQQHPTLVAQCMLTRTTSICQQQISVHTTQQQETGQYTFPALNQMRFSHSVQTSESSHAVCAAPFISPEILKRESKKVGQHQHFEQNVNKQNDILVTPTNQCSWLLVGRQNKHLSRKKLITIVGDLEIVGLVLW